MSGSALVFSRLAKLDHLDTVRYEIHMLRHSYSELEKRKLTEESAWIYLESFLLHYRNLVEFLGKKAPGGTDVHITNLWGLVGLPEPAGVAKLHTEGVALYDRYEPSDKMGGGRISQYLSHCTEKRIQPKDWEVSKMIEEIEPMLQELGAYLGPSTSAPFSPAPPIKVSSHFNASTTVGTATAAVVIYDPRKS